MFVANTIAAANTAAANSPPPFAESQLLFISFYSSIPALKCNVWSNSDYTLSRVLKHPPSTIDLEPGSSSVLGRGGDTNTRCTIGYTWTYWVWRCVNTHTHTAGTRERRRKRQLRNREMERGGLGRRTTAILRSRFDGGWGSVSEGSVGGESGDEGNMEKLLHMAIDSQLVKFNNHVSI
ncbi:hypothetical protein CRG98_027984 [Punica granatum]|uniref:Uncharacterized protein n=1 Tax=Punica granatum TaxID=22663 RepID=A0A2I0J5V4_PUNGR|nr:hypothetical protein CRG98_027984 [Punica granatum]